MNGRLRAAVAVCAGLGVTVIVGLSAAAASSRPSQRAGHAAAVTGAPPSCQRYVLNTHGIDTGSCTDPAHPCRTVQYAVRRAAEGDRICVAYDVSAIPAVYAGTVQLTKTVTLDGAWSASCTVRPPSTVECKFSAASCAPAKTVLDGLGAGRVISISGHVKPVIQCFTITGGDADEQFGDPDGMNAGGGIYSRDAAPVIVENIISGNFGCDSCTSTYGRGGGIYLLNAPSTALISGNLVFGNIADNSTWGQGGGIMVRDSDARILFNRIEHNRAGLSAGDGGGIMVSGGGPTIADNEIVRNVAGTAVMCNGGGIFVRSSEPVVIEGNHIESNWAITGTLGYFGVSSHGGGVYFAGDPTGVAFIRDNTFLYNVGALQGPHTGEGGGLYVSGLVSPTLVSGNDFEWNYGGHNPSGWGGGIFALSSTLAISGNRFRYNNATWAGSTGMGGGLYLRGSSALVSSNVFTHNYAAGFPGLPSTATGFGGAIALVNDTSLVARNRLDSNAATNADATGMGGGIYAEGGTPHVVENTIVSCTASLYGIGYGGGVAISDTQALVERNWIATNLAASDEPGYGGGIYILRGIATAVGNTITGNVASRATAAYGGGAYLDRTRSWLNANTLVGNLAAGLTIGRGGGIRISSCEWFTLTNNIVARNVASHYGPGIAIYDSNGRLAHLTIAQNSGGDGAGISYDSTDTNLWVDNSVIVTQAIGIHNSVLGTSTVYADYTLFEGNGLNYGVGVSSAHEVAGPAALRGDYRLEAHSGAINQAPLLVWVGQDIDGDPRPAGPLADVGVDELTWWIRLPVALRQWP